MKKLLLILSFITLLTSSLSAKEIIFATGPDGGVFRVFASGISEYLNANQEEDQFQTVPSRGSIESLKILEDRKADFAIVYSGDLFLGGQGKIDRRMRFYRNAQAVSYLYSSNAQLVVRKDSDINSIQDLVDKRVAVGSIGSGASASAERFFNSLGLWRKIKPMFLGYSAGADAMAAGQIDALWLFTGFPNPAVQKLTESVDIKMLSIVKEEHQELFNQYPFYTETKIPAGTYKGIDKDIITIADSTLWVAGRHVPADVVEKSLKIIYTNEGLAYLVNKKSTAKAMSTQDGTKGIVTPLHKGARKFWKQR
jgi:TRAP transporter TAXI family solute receptor